MNQDRFAEIERVCQAALDHPLDERAAFLDGACQGDEHLRSEVEALLAVESRAQRLMEAPPAMAGAIDRGAAPALSAGTRLGPYEIEAFADQGGMGEVYRARDTRLGRTVAIKVLPPVFSGDPDRRARFRREAKTIAGLSHPNICALYDVGEHPAAGSEAPELYLVMEHLTGETLAERLRKGPLRVEQALTVATQIADALAAAHREGIIHRDVKPANVMLTKSGAKLLDFGLAKLRADSARGASEGTSSPATRATATVPGAILGTVPYMAPEQLEGRAADARSDIFSFGAVLYEMLTGKRAFEAESSIGVAAAILEREPTSLAAVRAVGGAALERTVRKCLAKDPDQRWQSARDLADELRWLAAGADKAGETGSAKRRHAARPLVFGSLAVAFVAGFVAYPLVRSGRATDTLPVRLLLPVAPAEEVDAGGYGWSRSTPADSWRVIFTPGGSRAAFAWSPDGRTLVFVGRRSGRTIQSLYRRDLSGKDAQVMAGTESGQQPVYSGDGKWVAFTADDVVKKIPAEGGAVTEICHAPAGASPMGLTWTLPTELVFASGNVLWRVGAGGGQPREITSLEPGARHVLPHALPGGDIVLYTERREGGTDRIVAQPVDGGRPTVIVQNATDARYVSPGYLVFLRQGTLFAAPFDARALRVTGEAVAIQDGIAQALASGNELDHVGTGQFAVAPDGTMAFIASPVVGYPNNALVSIDRAGHTAPVVIPQHPYLTADASPDGRWLGVTFTTMAGYGFGIFDRSRDVLSILRDTDGAQSITFTADWRAVLINFRDHLVVRQIDGTVPDREIPGTNGFVPISVSKTGDLLGVTGQGENLHACILPAGGTASDIRRLPGMGTTNTSPYLSPDNCALAFAATSTTTGSRRQEVSVVPYPGPGEPVQVSADGGSDPAWNPRGGELFYIAPAGNRSRMMSATMQTCGTVRVLRSRALFDFDYRDLMFTGNSKRRYSVSPDGRSFVVGERNGQRQFSPVTHIDIVLNWVEEMKRKLAAAR